MTKEEWEVLREEACKQRSEDNLIFRSCWVCNLAHEHLQKTSAVLLCIACGHWYYKGEDLTKLEEEYDPWKME